MLASAFGWSFLVDLAATAGYAHGLLRFVGLRLGDLVAIGLVILLAFTRRWWGVALGLALVSVAPILWLAGTIG